MSSRREVDLERRHARERARRRAYLSREVRERREVVAEQRRRVGEPAPRRAACRRRNPRRSGRSRGCAPAPTCSSVLLTRSTRSRMQTRDLPSWHLCRRLWASSASATSCRARPRIRVQLAWPRPKETRMSSAYVYEAVRTPFGRYGGALSGVRPDDLAAEVLKALLARVPRARPGADRRRASTAPPTAPARTTATSRAWPCCSPAGRPRVPGATVNRLCGSSLEAAIQGSRAIETGDADDRRRRRRRGDEPLAVDPAEALARFPGRQRDALLLGARLAHGQPEDARAVDDLARREHREAGRDPRDHPRAAGRVRAAQPPARRQGLCRGRAQGGRAGARTSS